MLHKKNGEFKPWLPLIESVHRQLHGRRIQAAGLKHGANELRRLVVSRFAQPQSKTYLAFQKSVHIHLAPALTERAGVQQRRAASVMCTEYNHPLLASSLLLASVILG